MIIQNMQQLYLMLIFPVIVIILNQSMLKFKSLFVLIYLNRESDVKWFKSDII